MKEILGVKLYTLRELGDLLGVGVTTVYRYIGTGRLEARKIGARKYVTEENLKRFLQSSDNVLPKNIHEAIAPENDNIIIR